MSKTEKITPIVFIAILVILILDFVFLVSEHIDYEERKEYGNARWGQVDEILNNYEERIKKLEELLNSE